MSLAAECRMSLAAECRMSLAAECRMSLAAECLSGRPRDHTLIGGDDKRRDKLVTNL